MTENIEVFKQNSIRISAGCGTIYIDPFKISGQPNDADFILITHDHYDHFSPEDIKSVAGPHTILVVPEKMERKTEEIAKQFSEIVTVKPGAVCKAGNLELETVPAYNIMKPFHPKNAGWVGYILQIDGRRIYVAGDTDATKEAKAVQCDVALIPIGGFYTMDAKKAAELINTIRPDVAIPVHYGELVGKPEDGETFAGMVKAPTRVEFKISF